MRRTGWMILMVLLCAVLLSRSAHEAAARPIAAAQDTPARSAAKAGPLGVLSVWKAQGDQVDANLGLSVASAGDVNGDGYDDVIVGANLYDNGQTNEGRAFVYQGSATGLSTTANWTAESNQADASFGDSVASAGDVNGDGYDDVIVGSYQYTNGQTWEGGAFLYQGSATGLSTTANWTAEGDQAYAFFGVSVASAGDVNGDGYDDVIVGADDYDNGLENQGQAFLYQGSAGGLSPIPNWTAQANQDNAFFGHSVATAGDVNGDGYDDVIVGANHYGNGQTDEGRAFVYQGSATGLSTTANWTAESNQIGASLGESVQTAGDVNGDGYDDVIVGAVDYDNGQSNEGRAFVYQGSATGLSTTANWTAESNQAGASFGYSVASAGDVNGDGYADVIVGSPNGDHGQSNEGRASLYHGSAAGLSTTANWTAESNQADASFGYSVASAGDANGDGYDEVVGGAPSGDSGQSDEGLAVAFPGRPALA